MRTSDQYQGKHAEANRHVDSHGNTHDGDTFRAVIALRDEYRAKIAAMLPGLTKEGADILQLYLDGEDAAEYGADVCLWLEGCENHENGSDA